MTTKCMEHKIGFLVTIPSKPLLERIKDLLRPKPIILSFVLIVSDEMLRIEKLKHGIIVMTRKLDSD